MAEPDFLAAARAIGEAAAADPPSPDGEKAHSDRMLAAVRAAGLLSVGVPPVCGGPGLGVGDTARIAFELARGSGSVGLIYAMHMSQALTVVRHAADNPLFADFQARMVRDQILIASGTSEKGVGGNIFGSICTVEADGDRLLIVKETPNISYVDHAGAVLVSAMQAGPRGKPRQVLVLAEAADIEFEPGRESGFLGMRGILNRSYRIRARFGPEAVFGPTYPVIARQTMTPAIHIFWAALWSGLAARSIAKAKAYVAAAVPEESEVGQVVRHDLTRLADRHHQLNAMIRDAIADENANSARSGAAALDFGGAARINRLKVAGSELLLEIVTGAFRLIGLPAYALEGPYSLSAELRDAMSAPIMVSNTRLSANNAKIEPFVDERL